jgi:uncharacterized protein with PQ loop repeat
MVEQPKYKNIAIISSILTIVAFSYLVFRVHNTKETEHLTFIWLIIILLSQTLLFIYGFLNKFGFIYLQAFIILLGLIYILYIKINNVNVNDIDIESELRKKQIIV